MKLAFCLYKYFPYSGLSRDFMRILQECQNRGHELSVFAAEWQGDFPPGIEVKLLPGYRWMNHTQNAAFYRKLKPRLRSGNFDAVIGFNKMPGLDIYYGADYCYVGRAVPRYSPLYRLTPRYHHFHTFEHAVFSARSNTGILSLSECEKSVYQQFYGTPDRRFHLLPPTLDRRRKLNGADPGMRATVRTQLSIGGHENLLLFIGSGFKTKGLDRAIIALASLPDSLLAKSKLAVIGQDNARPFQRLAKQLGITDKVQFLGGRSDIPEILRGGDLLIHPAYGENTGTVLLEAIAAGLPVLTTDVCGYAPHIVSAQAGIVLRSPFGQDALNAQLDHMLTSDQRPLWSKNGIAYGSNAQLYMMPETAVDVVEKWTENNLRGANEQEVVEHEDGIRIYLRDDLRESLGEAGGFEDIMAIRGEVYREAPGRRTSQFQRGGRSYFLKVHTGVGWQEIMKNLAYFRLPVLGALNEWHGIHCLQRLGIDTLRIAGYGTTGGNPATRRSFILTDELAGTISLEDFCGTWKRIPPHGADQIEFKRWLIHRVAEISRMMHSSGANHRDFYLCHFLLTLPQAATPNRDHSRLHLIDMHRMQLRGRTPSRWVVKDIAGLYFSSMDINLTRRDLFRFMKAYRAKPIRQILKSEQRFWRRVDAKAIGLYATEKRRAQRRAVQGTRSATA